MPLRKLTGQTLVSPGTLAEGLYDTLIYHASVRLAPFVEMVTQSATVNHGGGLRKERERVYANPVHYAHALGHALAGGTPIAVRLTCETFSTTHAFAHIPPQTNIPDIDAIAVLTATDVAGSDSLVLSLVHRGADCGPIDLTIALEDFQAQGQAEVVTLVGETWYDRNTREAPEKVVPQCSSLDLATERSLNLVLAPYSIVQVKLRKAA